MPRFFTDRIIGDTYFADGENGRHIIKSLRMRVGENVTLCDGKGTDYFCEITDITADGAMLKINGKALSETEPNIRVHLYQCLPKSDKMDLIVQKAVELGVTDITPVSSENCVVTLKGKEDKKTDRWQKIALEAAKQSGRGIIPKVNAPLSFENAVKNSAGTKIMFYEGGGKPLKELLSDCPQEISVFVGPEGGFSAKEVSLAKENGVNIITLGKRILRTETAPIAGIAVIMYQTGNMD